MAAFCSSILCFWAAICASNSDDVVSNTFSKLSMAAALSSLSLSVVLIMSSISPRSAALLSASSSLAIFASSREPVRVAIRASRVPFWETISASRAAFCSTTSSSESNKVLISSTRSAFRVSRSRTAVLSPSFSALNRSRCSARIAMSRAYPPFLPLSLVTCSFNFAMVTSLDATSSSRAETFAAKSARSMVSSSSLFSSRLRTLSIAAMRPSIIASRSWVTMAVEVASVSVIACVASLPLALVVASPLATATIL
mmetsp:Transcript_19890/g.47798  ORF Transcript_19890/g.47798 Transcript_19890/m.47798 type:complete len:255 (-) Transcript_19890:641-1405(-)